MSTSSRSLRKWGRRKALWDRVYSQLFEAIEPPELPEPPSDTVPVHTWFEVTGQRIDGVNTGHPTPEDEHSTAKAIVTRLIAALRGVQPQLIPGLPEMPDDPDALIDEAWSSVHEKAFGHAPVLPPELVGGPNLGALMARGPFCSYVEKNPDGQGYVLDLSVYSGLPHRADARHLATRTLFLEKEGRLHEMSITELASGTVHTPRSEGWELARRTVACGLYLHATAIRHLATAHLFVSAPAAIAVRNALPVSHPLTRLLWPHVHGALDVNNTLGPALLDDTPGEGVFGDIFNLTAHGVWQFMMNAGASFDLRRADPHHDQQVRGMADSPVIQDTLTDALALWDILHTYCLGWVEHHYPRQLDIQGDPDLRTFLDCLGDLVPNGVDCITTDSPHHASLARLCTIVLYNAAVEHEIVGNLTWNYAPWSMAIPTRLHSDGSGPSLDVYQRFFNVLFATNVPSRPLMSDWTHLLTDPIETVLYHELQARLARRQAEMLAEGPQEVHRLYPEDLEAVVAV